jgi:transcriptional regulator with XRE-family HTH domain
MHDDDRAIGHRLRVTRNVLGITAEEAASAARVAVKTWLRWEAGHQMKGCFHLLCFARKYDVNLGWLITGETLHVGAHLAKQAGGKIAILPAMGPEQRRATAYQRQEAIARCNAGVEMLTDIARSFGVSHQTISRP